VGARDSAGNIENLLVRYCRRAADRKASSLTPACLSTSGNKCPLPARSGPQGLKLDTRLLVDLG
jgi:hypothetical protein